MLEFTESIDRIMPSCFFCLAKEIISLFDEVSPRGIDYTCPQGVFYLPNYYRIFPLLGNIRHEFLSFINVEYEYLLINLLNKDIFCIDNDLMEYIQLFDNPLTYREILAINKIGGYDNYFAHLVEEKFLFTNMNRGKTFEMSDFMLERYDTIESKTVELMCENGNYYTFLIETWGDQKYVSKCLRDKGPESHRELVLNEILIREKLKHPTFFPRLVYYDIDSSFFVTEYVDGCNLESYTKRNLCIDKKIRLIESIVLIICYLHVNNIIHGDLHLGQFMVASDNTLKLLDLELSIDLDSTRNSHLDFAGGAFEYIEPEIVVLDPFKLLKTGNGNKKGEVYRLGVLLYYILYDEFPHMELTWKQLFRAKTMSDPVFKKRTKNNEAIPPNLINALKKCLSRKPGNRFSSAQELYNKIM